MRKPSVLFVGESPPLGAAPDFRPFDCASGKRLAKILGFTDLAVLLEHVPRDNIFRQPGVGMPGGPKWDPQNARICGEALLASTAADTIVALGRRTGAALGVAGSPPWGTWSRGRLPDIVVAPHPSGASTALGTDEAKVDCRRYLLPELVAGCPTLRPWHFDLSDPGVLLDLGAAVSPYDVGLGVAVVRVACEVHRAQAVPTVLAREGVTLDGYREHADVSLQCLVARAHDEIVCVPSERPVAAFFSRELRLRARAAAKDPRVKCYPVSVLRATIGRYVAVGVL